MQKHGEQVHDVLDSSMLCPYKDECGKKGDFTHKNLLKISPNGIRTP